jgi:hypothetical protein
MLQVYALDVLDVMKLLQRRSQDVSRRIKRYWQVYGKTVYVENHIISSEQSGRLGIHMPEVRCSR